MNAEGGNADARCRDHPTEHWKETLMPKMRSKTWLLAGLLVMTPPLAGTSLGQARFPSKPIEIIVPFAAGGGTDVGARVVAEVLEKQWKVPVKIINKTGGNTLLAGDTVMKAAPDGYTILADSTTARAALSAIVPDLPFKVTDRTNLAVISTPPVFLYVGATSPFKTLDDVAAEVRKDPTAFTWTSFPGVQQITAQGVVTAAGIDYKITRPVTPRGGGTDAALMVAGGQIKLGATGYQAISPMITANKIRVLAVASRKRSSSLPDVPTTAEVGYPGVLGIHWNGFSGPPNMPAEVVEVWKQGLRAAMSDPGVQAAFTKAGLDAVYIDGPEMDKMLDEELKEYAAILGPK